jgi:hypothetical protein
MKLKHSARNKWKRENQNRRKAQAAANRDLELEIAIPAMTKVMLLTTPTMCPLILPVIHGSDQNND